MVSTVCPAAGPRPRPPAGGPCAGSVVAASSSQVAIAAPKNFMLCMRQDYWRRLSDASERPRPLYGGRLATKARTHETTPYRRVLMSRTVERGPRLRHRDHGCDESHRGTAVSLGSGADRRKPRTGGC